MMTWTMKRNTAMFAPSTPTFMTRSLSLLVLLLAVRMTSAQTATDACGFTAGARYTVNSSCTLQAFDKPASFVPNGNPGSCGAGNNDDAWGWFQATATTTAITYDPAGAEDAILHVFSGACGALALVGCANNGGNGIDETVTIATAIGTNYAVRVQRAATDNAMTGSLCVWNPPVNDIPCTATTLTVNSSCTYTAGTNVNSTAAVGIPNPSCALYTGTDVWYSFVAPVTGIANIESTAGSLTNSGISLYSATACGGTFTEIECDDDDGPGNMGQINRTGLTPGVTYYIRVWGFSGAVGTFNLCVWAPPPPANDNPCAAITLTVGTSCTTIAGTNVNATATPPVAATV